MRLPRLLQFTVLAAVASLGAWLSPPTRAQSLSWSTYGTVGLARSDRAFTYQRFIDRQPSAGRDTVFGLQADAALTPQWSATVQLKLAPSAVAESRWDVRPAWAFLGWRPGDDWLVRVGRFRVPLYLNSETLDVGQTHDMVRLPTEQYTITPTNDFDGAYLSRSWALGSRGDSELTLDLVRGAANSAVRFWYRDGLPPSTPAGAFFMRSHTRLNGLALSWRQPGLALHGSLFRTRTHRRDGQPLPSDLPFVQLAPGLGYYQVDNALPGPGVPQVASARNTVLSLGSELSPGDGWRVAAEFVRNRQHDTPFGLDATAGYIAVFRQIGAFTPYASVARLRGSRDGLDWYRRLTTTTLPDSVPGAAQINAAQRLTAESFWLADQRSWALGTSMALTPHIKLKAEWLSTRIGAVSRLVDTPAGQDTPHHTTVNVQSVNLSYAF